MPKKSESPTEEQLAEEKRVAEAKAALRENIIEALRHARRGGHLNTVDIDNILEYIGA